MKTPTIRFRSFLAEVGTVTSRGFKGKRLQQPRWVTKWAKETIVKGQVVAIEYPNERGVKFE